jgi:signal transduction histidine kinase/ActR/RegA family two-component response regulator
MQQPVAERIDVGLIKRPYPVLLYLICILYFLWPMPMPMANAAPDEIGRQAVLDLSNRRPTDSDLTALNGQWAFFGNRLLTPQDFSDPSHVPVPDTYVVLPKLWNDELVDGQKMGRFGMATYRLKLILPKQSPDHPVVWGLEMPVIFSAARLYANGFEIASAGLPAPTAQDERARVQSKIVALPAAEEIDLILQVSNHIDARGGPYGAFQLGDYDQLSRQKVSHTAFVWMIAGMLVAFGLYFSVYYLVARDNFGYMALAAMSLLAAMRILLFSRIVYQVVPDLSHIVVIRLEAVCVSLLIPAYIRFAHWVLPDEFPKPLVRITLGLGLVLAIGSIIAPFDLLTQSPPLFLTVIALALIYAAGALITAIIRKREEAVTLALLYLLSFLPISAEGLMHFGWRAVPGPAYFAVLIYIFAHVVLISRRRYRALLREETMSRNLTDTNQLLESRVAERTRFLEVEMQRRSEAEARATAESESKTNFLVTMSHEIRTPLTGILGMATLLSETIETPEERKQVQMIVTAGEVLRDILSDVLDLAKIEAGQMELVSTSFRLDKVCSDVVNLLTANAKVKDLDLHLNIDGNVPMGLYGDVRFIRQVLLNLVGNAIKFTHRGEVRLTVTAAPSTTGYVHVRFEVSDTGIGISPSAIENLFTPFAQGDHSRSRQYGGTGLGLSISQKLIELMGGTIHVVSKLGEGTQFTVEIPIQIDQHQYDIAQDRAPAQIGAQKSRTILVAEDNPVNQIVTRLILERAGHHVVVVGDGVEAVGAVKKGAFDLVIMDLQMPAMDGIEATYSIRNLPESQKSRVPIIALSANAFSTDEEQCFKAGMNAYLSKPVHPAKLLSCIDEIIAPKQVDQPMA